MGRIAHAIRWFVEQAIGSLDFLPPAISLAVIAGVTAVVMLLVVGRVTPQRLVGRARAQVAASIYEMRLYLDRPSRLLAAQGRLAGWSVIYLGCLLPAVLVMAIPLGLLFLHLETRHGLAPLPVPSTVVVRIELADGVPTRDVHVEASGALAVTAPLIHADDEHAVYARVAIRAPGEHSLVVHAGGATIHKLLVADPEADVVAPERSAGLAQLWSLGAEPALTGPVRSIAVPHPDRPDELPVRWWLYWLLGATGLALALKRRFGVEL